MSGLRRTGITKAQRDILRKRWVLEHAERIGNIRRTCRYFGVARSASYLQKQAYETYGDEGLLNKEPCPVIPKLRTAPEIVEKVLCLRRTYHLTGPVVQSPEELFRSPPGTTTMRCLARILRESCISQSVVSNWP